MRLSILLLSYFLLLANSQIISQSECAKLLEEGIYQYINHVKRNPEFSFTRNMKEYFFSSKFYDDLKSKRWGDALSFNLNGNPIKILSTSTDSEIAAFKTTIENSPENSMQIVDFEPVVKQFVNMSLHKEYNNCKKIFSDPFIKGIIKGNKIETEETVNFVFYYKPETVNQAPPRITSFIIDPQSSIIESNGIKKGKRLSDEFYHSVLSRRSEVSETVFVLETVDVRIDDVSAPISNATKEIPIGTIISSYAKLDVFRTFAGEKPGPWNSGDLWAPCDGRDIAGSKLASYLGSHAPDLRGYFIRGLNTFDTAPPPSVNKVVRDPDDSRLVGSSQADEFKKHNHLVQTYRGTTGIGPSQRPIEGSKVGGEDNHYTNESGSASETRPMNVALYYYIKIN